MEIIVKFELLRQ